VNGFNLILGGLATVSCGIVVWQFLAARKFPLHQRIAGTSFAPAVSILKPLKGCDATTADSLASWFGQNYAGRTQILFGVADATDPVCGIVEELLKQHPAADAQLIICDILGNTNAKVAKLAQLEKLAHHELILVSDADVRVPPDFLTNFVTPLQDKKVGLVNCFYRLANPVNTAMRWEAIAVNVDFWSQVLQSQTLMPLDFALGAAILLRRKGLEEIGGFDALTNCLADDYQLGNRIFKNGHHIALCPVVIECWDAPMSWTQVWKHQIRWARTIRVCQPVPYFFSILSNGTIWPLLWLFASLASSQGLSLPLMAIGFLLVRVVLAQKLQYYFTPGRKLISNAWLVTVKDLLNTAIWISAFSGNTVEWRGRKMRLLRDGTLVEKSQPVWQPPRVQPN
jgi:ceramide glucosyltransferase